MDRDQIEKLIERLEQGSGPDLELGKEILLALGGTRTCVGRFYGPLYQWTAPWGASFDEDDFRRYNPVSSIDAAVALTEKMLPFCVFGIRRRGYDMPSGATSLREAFIKAGGLPEEITTYAGPFARALLSALLHALLQQPNQPKELANRLADAALETAAEIDDDQDDAYDEDLDCGWGGVHDD